MLKFRFKTLTVSDGTSIPVPDSGVTIFVGPNNAGKSQSLKDLIGHMRSGPGYIGKTITGMESSKEGEYEDALAWARENLSRVVRDGIPRTSVHGWGEVQDSDFASQWGGHSHLNVLTDTFILHADGTTRLTAGNAQQNLDFRTQFPTHPIQRASRDPRLEKDFSAVGKAAFGLEVTVDRYAGSVVPLRLGPRPPFEHDEGVPTLAYLDALASLPQLEEQGDGVKSFLGLMTQLIAGTHQVILVDEPEAFLHPPQARLLGRLLAQRAADQQVFIATHSADILQGALEAGSPVTIIRLTRDGGVNRAAVLSHKALEELWADPLLRYSDVLDGLFHDAVILCESDSDCRYYAAVRDHLFPEGEGLTRRTELLFTHCGGKGRLPVVIRALRAVRVPVIVIPDFDILRDEGDVKRTVEALEEDWSSLAKERGILAGALASETKPLRKTATKDALLEALDRAEEVLTTSDVDALRAILKVETGWDKVKRAGISGVPQGGPFSATEKLLTALQSYGVLVVPVGELERFVPSVGGHGPGWVNEVLAQRLHASPSVEAKSFVTLIEETAKARSGHSATAAQPPT